MREPTSTLGRQLLTLLPEVYGTRDKKGDLAAYLDACGALLDLVRRTEDQLLADAFPVPLPGGRAAQDWILPYLAQLLDVRLISPHVHGRREEVGRAVTWRQKKGTVRAVEEIAEVVGQLEVEVQEGWTRMAVTPRVGIPVIPAAALGEPAPDGKDPLAAALHPGLPAVTPDLTRSSRAVRSTPEDPGARVTRFGDDETHWRQAHRHGVPCFLGSFDDSSRRTPDLRTPDWGRGHAHPRRALLFTPPPPGFFPPDDVKLKWSERQDPAHTGHVAEVAEGDEIRIFNPSEEPDSAGGPVAVTITTNPSVFTESKVTINGIGFHGTVTVNGGRVELQRVAAHRLVIQTDGVDQPVLVARDCLFDEVEVPDGLVRLEYCTIREHLKCPRLQASDVILAGEVMLTGGAADRKASCVRFSRIPESLAERLAAARRSRSTTDQPVFFDFRMCDPGGVAHHSVDFGEPGLGVLHPASPASICFGAEDGGEMGAYHHRRYCLQSAAVLAKLRDFLPVGIDAVLVPDARLLTAPPALSR